MVELLAMASGGILLSLSLHSFYHNTPTTGMLLAILFMLLLISATRKSNLKLPPGPSGVPILGYLPFLGENPHRQMAKLAKKYGPLVHIQLGSFPGLVVTSPRLAKEVLMTQDQNFASHPQTINMEYFAYYNDKDKIRRGIASAKLGAYFRNLRRLVALELMSPKRMRFLEGVRNEEMQRMVHSLLEDANCADGVANLNSAISGMTMNVISRTIAHKRYFGKDLADQQEAREFQKMFHTMLRWVGYIFLADFLPILRPVTRLFSTERAMAETAKRADAFLETILQEHRQKRNTDEASQDFVDMMLTSPGEDGKYLDDNTIKVLTLECFLAGTDTPSVTTEWILAELLCHPEVMHRLQSDLDRIVGTDRHVRESDLPNLPYLNAIVKETFRLHPAAPLLIPHESAQQTQIDGYDIPANTRVFVNTWAMGRDTANWENPTEFNPDRFMDGKKSEIDIKGGHFELLAFGSGRRRCPGMPLGSLLVNLAVARLVHGFRILLPSGMRPEDLDLSEIFGINLSMKVPLSCVRIKPRLRLDLYQLMV
ncbi:hypothetical protein KC19_3G120800 [Ceratodon purpureus]|uniref:Cytochrome P450 n=1 Tax=Ceratodon purpureus TaxID=3225 RepID=A0A8T0IK77_CERPU|nr:hypothetical protein KC19_3G120800 [Ceratodon purpureus]